MNRSTTLGAVNGGWPVSISNRMTPRLYRSADGVMRWTSRDCSGGHVQRCADEVARTSDSSRGLRGQEPHDAEVQQLDVLMIAPGPHHDVGRFDVAMDELLSVCLGQAGGDLAGEVGRPNRGEGGFGGDDFGQRPPVHVLHDQEGQAVVGGPKVGHRHHIGMTDLADDLGLAPKALHDSFVRGQVPEEDFHRVLVLQESVSDSIDASHRAQAQALKHTVPVEDAANERICGLFLELRPIDPAVVHLRGVDGEAVGAKAHRLEHNDPPRPGQSC